MSRWTWAERGSTVELHTEPGGFYRLAVGDGYDDATARSADLPVAAVLDLREFIVGSEGDDVRAGLEEALTVTEGERDEALERVKVLEGQLREALATVEQHRTALDLADQRQRALDELVEGWSADGDARRAEYRIAKSTAARAVREATS